MFNKDRRPDYDVTNSVKVSSTDAVSQAVYDIFHSLFPDADYSPVKRAFDDFERLFEGDFNGFQACDTFYHDKQHTLDMTLALSRLIEGYQRRSDKSQRFMSDQVRLAIITALFHDAGYIRKNDDDSINGAVYTLVHVSRSSHFLSQYLPMIGLDEYAPIAANIVHYTGYELKPDNIQLPSPLFHTLGYMLGTADLIAQMSDRCYLEKCRDRLFPEFVLGNVAETEKDGRKEVIYSSGNDLLEKTPLFYQKEIKGRLTNLFNNVYEYAEDHFGESNLYIDALEANQSYLNTLLEENRLESLTRLPLQNKGTIFASNSTLEEIKNLKIR